MGTLAAGLAFIVPVQGCCVPWLCPSSALWWFCPSVLLSVPALGDPRAAVAQELQAGSWGSAGGVMRAGTQLTEHSLRCPRASRAFSGLSCCFLSPQVQIQNKKVDLSKVSSKCGSKANIKHKPGKNFAISSFVCKFCPLNAALDLDWNSFRRLLLSGDVPSASGNS